MFINPGLTLMTINDAYMINCGSVDSFDSLLI
jgi:hypothetical protein